MGTRGWLSIITAPLSSLGGPVGFAQMLRDAGVIDWHGPIKQVVDGWSAYVSTPFHNAVVSAVRSLHVTLPASSGWMTDYLLVGAMLGWAAVTGAVKASQANAADAKRSGKKRGALAIVLLFPFQVVLFPFRLVLWCLFGLFILLFGLLEGIWQTLAPPRKLAAAGAAPAPRSQGPRLLLMAAPFALFGGLWLANFMMR
jgi:hypothetical protein